MISAFSGRHAFLSNFFKATITYNGIVYPTAEHAFQAQKTLDENDRNTIAGLPYPGRAKKYGKTVKLREDWDNIKVNIMKEIVTAKFDSSPHFKQALLETSSEELTEGNNWNDTYWGICNGIGSNHLGKILMEIRAKYQMAADKETLVQIALGTLAPEKLLAIALASTNVDVLAAAAEMYVQLDTGDIKLQLITQTPGRDMDRVTSAFVSNKHISDQVKQYIMLARTIKGFEQDVREGTREHTKWVMRRNLKILHDKIYGDDDER